MAIIGFINAARNFRADVLKLDSGYGVQIVDSLSGVAGPVSAFRDMGAAMNFAKFCAEAE